MSDNISVSIFMGSKSDLPVVQAASDTLKEFGIPHRMLFFQLIGRLKKLLKESKSLKLMVPRYL